MKSIGKTIIFAVALLSQAVAHAQGGADAIPFVRTEFGSVIAGSAGAAVASTETGAWGVFRNASALAFNQSVVVGGGEFRSNGDGNMGVSASVAGKVLNRIGAGFGLAYLGGDEVGGFKTSDFLFMGGMAYGITGNLSVGLNVRYARQNLTESVSYSAASVDFGTLVKVSDQVSATIGLAALGGKVKSASGTEYSQPANVYAGAEYTTDIEDFTLGLDAMGEYYFSGNYGAAIGASLTYDNLVTLRTGYRIASEWCALPSHFAAGLEGKLGAFGINIGFAKMPATYVLRTGIEFSF